MTRVYEDVRETESSAVYEKSGNNICKSTDKIREGRKEGRKEARSRWLRWMERGKKASARHATVLHI